MQINYEAEARRKQEERNQQRYQAQRDPFAYGQEVARRRYSEIMSGLEQQQGLTAKAYSDMYQAAKQSDVARRGAGGPSLSGGMKTQYSDLLSARQIQELGQLGGARERSLRELELQKQSAFANAQLEGQQAEQLQLQRQQTELGIIQQKNQILADTETTKEQKAEQLRILGFNEAADKVLTTDEKAGPSVWSGIIPLVAGVPALKAFAGKGLLVKLVSGLFGGGTAATIGASALVATAAVAATLYGIERIAETQGVNEGQGFFDLAILGMK